MDSRHGQTLQQAKNGIADTKMELRLRTPRNGRTETGRPRSRLKMELQTQKWNQGCFILVVEMEQATQEDLVEG